MLKKNNKSILLTVSIATALAALTCTTPSNAEVTDQGGVFFYGKNIQVGLNKHAAFGSDMLSKKIPYASSPKAIGFISDPKGRLFSEAYDGDFFIEGATEAGWGVHLNGINYHNTRNYQDHIEMKRIVGKFGDFKDYTSNQEITWTGDINKALNIQQTFSIYSEGLSVIVDVEMTNTSDKALKNTYYMQTFDPDNNYQSSHKPEDLKTTNQIISQGDKGGIAIVSAEQKRADKKTNSEIKLIGYAKNARVAHGGFTNRDPIDIYTGTAQLKTQGSKFADEAISLAFKFDEIAVGETVKFKLAFQLSGTTAPTLTLDKDNSSKAEYQHAYKTQYIVAKDKIRVTDNDLEIKSQQGDNLRGAIIVLNTAHDNDILELSGNLPLAITKDTEQSSETKLVLKGKASIEDYKKALSLVHFSNTSNTPALEERALSLFVLDDIYTLSNAAPVKIGVLMPIIIQEKIALDNKVNSTEQKKVSIAGKATPNLNVVLVFTDHKGGQISLTTKTNALGLWNTLSQPIDLSALADGNITLKATTSNKGYTITNSSLFEKDTSAHTISVISPPLNHVIKESTLRIKGTAEPKTKITLHIKNQESCNTTTDAKGEWYCTVNKLSLDKTYPIEIISTDTAGNTDKIKHSIKTAPLNISINSPKDNQTIQGYSPVISGKSLLYVDITVTAGDKRCTTTSDDQGNWQCTLDNLPLGTQQQIVATASLKGEEKKTAEIKINIPKNPLSFQNAFINEPLKGTALNIAGKTTPKDRIIVKIDDDHHCATIADEQGDWRCTINDLALGKTYPIKITSTNAEGNQYQYNNTFKTSPLTLKITSPSNNATVDGPYPLIVGKSLPNTNILVAVADKHCETKSDALGHWHCTLKNLPIGNTQQLIVTAEAAGVKKTAEINISVPNNPLVIVSPPYNAHIKTTQLHVSGKTHPNEKVVAQVDETHYCSTTSDNLGEWHCVIAKLQLGKNYPLNITATDSKGYDHKAKSIFITDPLTIEISNPQDNAKLTQSTPLVSGKSTPNAKITVFVNNHQQCETQSNTTGDWRCKVNVLASDNAQSIAATVEAKDGTTKIDKIKVMISKIPLVIESPKNNALILDNTITIKGKTDPLANISVSTGVSDETCTAIANQQGEWQCAIEIKHTTTEKTLYISAKLQGSNPKTTRLMVRLPKKESNKEVEKTEKVKTALKGSGSTSPFEVLFILLSLLFLHKLKKIKSKQ